MGEKKTEAARLLRELLQAQLVERCAPKATACVTGDVMWMGGGDIRDVCCREQADAYFASEVLANPGAYALTVLSTQQIAIGEQSGVAMVKAVACRDFAAIRFLVTATTRPEDGQEKICALHLSMLPEEDREGGRAPFSLTKRFADSSYREFIENSISAGIVGGYFEKGYPLYTVNYQFLEMLGYASEEEFEQEIGGNLMVCVHPDDRETVTGEIVKQLGEWGRYSGRFRLRRKDGVYLRMETQGKTVSAENGRTVLICVCRDVTLSEQNVERLSRLADQLSLYRASQNAGAYRVLADEQYTLLYGNDRFYQILEYTEAELRQAHRGSILTIVHPDDRETVRGKLDSARRGENKYLDLVMRVYTGRGRLRYVQLVGEFISGDEGHVLEGIIIDMTAQKAIELQLHERNAIFDVLLENSNLSMCTYDRESHVATLISSKQHRRPMSFEGTANYPESVIATGIVRSSSVEAFRDALRRIDSGEPMVTAEVWYDPEDAPSWCDRISYISIFDRDGRILRTVGIAEDITEQKLAQRKYEEELYYQQSLQSENILVKVRCNLTKNKVESYVGSARFSLSCAGASYSDAIETMAAACYTREEGENVLRLFRAERVIAALEQGEHFCTVDYRRRACDGRVYWVNSSVKTYRDMVSGDIKSFVYTSDINRDKVNEELIRTVSAIEHDYIALVDVRSDEYRLFNGNVNGEILPTAGNRREYSRSVAEINAACVHPEDLERCNNDMMPETMVKNLAATGRFSAIYQVYDERGELRIKNIQYSWLSEELGLVVMTRNDVTDVMREQQRQQELLKNALRQAEDANNAKTNFLSKMSHEIRTPMNAIIGMNALAAQNITDPTLAGDFISKVGISARYLLTLINDILDMSRIESGKLSLRREKIPFQEFLSGINTIVCEQAADAGLSYDSILTGFVAESYVGDATKLQQILVNLLGNAVKFTPRGGKVQLMIGQEREENGLAHMRFVVNDTGVGISEEFQKVMFEPFEQETTGITTPYGGTGLGLAITKNLVELMGGSISANSIMGVGTEFSVTLPLEIDPEAHPCKPLARAQLSKMSALVVDDEVLICQQTQTILTEIGMRAEWVTGGAQAVELVQTRWEKKKYFDIILVDWKMPEMDGIETARRIRAIVGPDVTIIVITAYEWAGIEKEAKAAGVNLLIAKPLFKSTLVSTFERILAPGPRTVPAPKPVEYDFTGRRVLLVEDHLLNVEVAKRMLESRGMQVEVAENGLVAIETFARTPVGYFDAILMDIRMPVMDGLTATRSIRQMKKPTAKTIPIIAMSANAFDEDMERSRVAGMNAHLSKPIEPQTLYETVARFVPPKE